MRYALVVARDALRAGGWDGSSLSGELFADPGHNEGVGARERASMLAHSLCGLLSHALLTGCEVAP